MAKGEAPGPGRVAWRGIHARTRLRAAAHPRGRAGRPPRLLGRLHRRGVPRALPRPGARAPARRRGDRAAAPGRAGHLGRLLGQEAAQVGSGRALRDRRHGLPDLPRARRRLLPRRRPAACRSACSAASTTAAGTRTRPTSTCTRSSSARSRCTPPATRWASPRTARSARDDGEAVIAYFGDGATSQGDVNEAFVWASVFNAPVVFFCQNNQYAISEPLERQTRVPLYQRAAGFGFPGVRVDGNDVLAVLAVTRAALDDARSGQGPTLDRGVHLPDGRAHHLRRPDPLPARQRGRGVAGQGPDRPGQARSSSSSGIADDDFFDEVDAEADELAARHPRAGARRCPTRPGRRCSTTSTPNGSPELDEQRAAVRRRTCASFEGSAH